MDVALVTGPAVLESSFDLDDTTDPPEVPGAPSIVTPGRAPVRRVLFGKAPALVKLVIAGGKVGDEVLNVSDEVAPSRSSLTEADTLLLIGEWVPVPGQGRSLELWFAYSVDDKGTATSLLSSGSNDPYPSFALADYEQAIAAKE